MIKLEKTEVVGWEAATRGMRNPMNSWAKSDSKSCPGYPDFCDLYNSVTRKCADGHTCSDREGGDIVIGPNDHELMMKLAKGGPVHAKFRRMIEVYVDITAPLYWWKEFDTYKVGTVANSCSTMHKIHAKEFTLEDFSCEHLGDGFLPVLKETINALNSARHMYLEFDETIKKGIPCLKGTTPCTKKDVWWQMIQLLPSSYNQKRTVMLSYEVLVGMYRDRKAHKLNEWVDFCKFIETLPYSELITGAL